eukprot:GHVT01064620.1.p2 GENE.GHVT01064620.1~~GHVT01064620.1.p2  ORF type:complete len:232 (+),score=6.47 GHVT01064620.1:4342-5037(+)
MIRAPNVILVMDSNHLLNVGGAQIGGGCLDLYPTPHRRGQIALRDGARRGIGLFGTTIVDTAVQAPHTPLKNALRNLNGGPASSMVSNGRLKASDLRNGVRSGRGQFGILAVRVATQSMACHHQCFAVLSLPGGRMNTAWNGLFMLNLQIGALRGLGPSGVFLVPIVTLKRASPHRLNVAMNLIGGLKYFQAQSGPLKALLPLRFGVISGSGRFGVTIAITAMPAVILNLQ